MIIDTLEVLITGDASGIDKVVKQALSIVEGGVDKMNDEEVDWTSIFSRAVSPAIISSVATMFAFAIAQSVQFQAALNQTGAAAGDSSTQIAQVGTAALGVSTVTGQSANDIADAMATVGTVFGKGSQATTDVVQNMSELAQTFGEPLSDVVSSAMALFQQFGITTESTAITALTDLMHGATATNETFSEFTNSFNSISGPLVNAGANVSSLAGLVSNFGGTIQALGLPNAIQEFTLLGQSAKNPVGPMELLGDALGIAGTNTGAITQAIQSGNLAQLLDNVATGLNNSGAQGLIVAEGLGLSAIAIDAFTTRAKNLPSVDTDTKNIATDTESIKTAFNDADSALLEFQKDWAKLEALFTSSGIANFFEGMAKDIGNALTDLQNLVNLWQKLTSPNVTTSNQGESQVESFVGTEAGSFFNSLITSLEGTLPAALIKLLTQTPSSSGGGNQNPISTSNNSTVNVKNTFNVQGGPNTSSQGLAKSIYNQFQGTQP